LAGSLALVTCREPLRMSLTTNIKKSFEMYVKLENYEVNEEDINEVTVLASRENLEFGCTLIKKEVIDKALKKVREDPQILQAIEKRKRAQELGIK
jgi:CCR4-NOT transcription complex subunit 1